MAAEISQLLTELSALSHHDGRPETVRPHPNVVIPWHKSAMPQDGLRVAMRYPPGSALSILPGPSGQDEPELVPQVGQHLLRDDLSAGGRHMGAIGSAHIDHLARSVGDEGRVGARRIPEEGPGAEVVDGRLGERGLLL